MVTSIASRRDYYWFEHGPLLVEMSSYIGAHRVPIRGASSSCDGAGSPLALVEISQRRKVDDSKYGKFVPLLGSIRSPMLGRSAYSLGGGASVSFPYYVIGGGRRPILVVGWSYIGRKRKLYRFAH